MPFFIIIAVAVILFIKAPALFAWNHTGLVTLIIFTLVIARITVGRRRG